MNPVRYPSRILLIGLLLAVMGLGACASKLVPLFSHQGRLLDANGNPVADGNYDFTYKIFQVASGGTAVHTETKAVAVEGGLFTTSVGLSPAIDPTIFAQPTWLEITVEGQVLGPRQRLQGSPFAFTLVSGSVIQGGQPLDRDFGGQVDTGAALTVLNNDSSATGGHGLLAINRAIPANVADKDKVAAMQARAVGTGAVDSESGYGAIVTSSGYRGMKVESDDAYYAAAFDSNLGIILIGGSCNGCALAYMARNAGDTAINAGDFVAVEGVETDAEQGIPVMIVRRATGPDDAIIGVATGNAARTPVGEHNGVSTGGFGEGDGPTAAPGGYLSVIVQGLVRVNAAGTSLQPGAQISAGPAGATAVDTGGFKALSAVDGDGMVWIMLSGE
jgi:hypothetical protein